MGLGEVPLKTTINTMTENLPNQSNPEQNNSPPKVDTNQQIMDKSGPNHKEIQTDEPSYLQNLNKTTKTNHISFFTTNNTTEDNNNKGNEMTVTSCFTFLLQTFKERLQKNQTEVIQFIQLLLVLIFGLETAMIFGVINLLFHLCIKGDNKHNMPDMTKLKEKLYEDLNLPKQSSINLRKRINSLTERRKKKEYRTDSETEESEEEEVYAMPDIPSDIPITSKFTITGNCGETPVDFEIDTGSGHSIINKETYEKLKPHDILAVKKTNKNSKRLLGQCHSL